MACGDLVKFQVEVGEDNTINKAVFKAFGCGSVIASSAYATELLQGKSLEDAYNISNLGGSARQFEEPPSAAIREFPGLRGPANAQKFRST